MSSSVILNNHATPLSNGRPYFQSAPGSAAAVDTVTVAAASTPSGPKSLLKTVGSSGGGGNIVLKIVDTNNNNILRKSGAADLATQKSKKNERVGSSNSGHGNSSYKFNLNSILANKSSSSSQNNNSQLLVGFDHDDDDDHLPPQPTSLQQPSPPGSTTSSTSSTSSCSAATSSTSSSSLIMLNGDAASSSKKLADLADDFAVGADYMDLNGQNQNNQSAARVLFDQSLLSSNSFNTTTSSSSTSYYSTNTSITSPLSELTNSSLKCTSSNSTNTIVSSSTNVSGAKNPTPMASNESAQKSQKSKKRVQFISEEKLDDSSHRSSSSSPKISVPVNKRNSRADQAHQILLNATPTTGKAGSTLPFAARDLQTRAAVQAVTHEPRTPTSILVNTRPSTESAAAARSSSLRKVSIKLNTMDQQQGQETIKSLENLPSSLFRGTPSYQQRQATSNVGNLLIRSPLVTTANQTKATPRTNPNYKSHSYIVPNSKSGGDENKPSSSMSTSTTMPAISSNLGTGNLASTRKHFSSYTLSEKDNPFRPEGQLAKEANEFLKEMKEKSEREANQIIQTTLNNSSLLNTSGGGAESTPSSPSKNRHQQQQPSSPTSPASPKQSTSTPVKQQQQQDAANANASSTNNNNRTTSEPFSISTPTTPNKPQSPTAATTTTNKSKGDAKSSKSSKSKDQDKTKPKCGCTIS